MAAIIVHSIRVLTLLVLTATVGPTAQSPGLITLHRVGPGPTASEVHESTFRHSGWLENSTFEGQPAGSRWNSYLWFRYSHCPATARGAFRLTVYVSRSPLGVPPYRHSARYRRQYARTIIDLRESDDATYTFPVAARRYYPFHIVIPGAAGCQSWQMDAGYYPDVIPACRPSSAGDGRRRELRDHLGSTFGR